MPDTCPNYTPSPYMGNMPSSVIKTKEYQDEIKKAQNNILKNN